MKIKGLFSLTPQERWVLFLVGILIMGGGFLRDFLNNRKAFFDREVYFSASSDCIFPININRAEKEKLMCLPGVGEVIAERIIKRRNLKGDIKNLESLKEIKGLGEGKIEKLKNKIIF